MKSKKKLLLILVIGFIASGLGFFVFTGMFTKSSDSISYREIEISPKGVNDVWGSIISDELAMEKKIQKIGVFQFLPEIQLK